MITIKEAEEILKHEYHIDNYLFMVKELILPDYVSDAHEIVFNNNIFERVTQLGYSSKCEVSVFEVLLKEGAQNRRVTITQEMFRILRGQGVSNAIVAFSNADKRNYRLSLLTSKYEFDGNKIVKVLSNPRRYSYSLGYGTKTKTAYDFLISKGKVHSLDELIGRFSLEIVNKHFYNEIAASFTKLIGGKRDGKTFEKELNIYSVTNQNKYAEFAVRLIGRIVFCWFLKEKKSENGIPLIPEKMLSAAAIAESSNYYHDVLEPLFFELLNTNQNRRKGKFAHEEIYKQIPYLNGGLFAPHLDDKYKYSPATQTGQYGIVTIPNEWFDHFFSVLSQYNFTVDENTSYDIELSIDPEMLGRIFENLLAEINPETGENAKKSTGSFYTPRDIVDYMVDNSIFEYLKSKTGIDNAKLKALISYSKDDDDIAVFTKEEKKAIINALYTITVLDPACGSGAFPIGMLQKIVYMLQEIDPEANLWFDKATENVSFLIKKEFEKKFNAGSLDYIRKLSVIQNSIFGVDIQPIAVEIARLRCFLSLVIEEKVMDTEFNRGINPLPSLDFKFIIANSLIPLEESKQISLFENQDHIEELKAIRERYFNADNEEKSELREEFADIQKRMLQTTIDQYTKLPSKKYELLYRWSPFKNEATDWFDPEWMFGVKDGFDIVIGNPPYISAPTQLANAELLKQRNALIESKRYKSLCQKWDLYIPFLEFGLISLKKNGILTMIVPYPLTNQNYAKKIREIFTTECDLVEIVDLSNVKVFDAMIQNCIPFAKKASPTGVSRIANMEGDFIKPIFMQEHTRLIQDAKTQVWNLTQEIRQTDKHKKLYTLGDFCYISVGMVLNSDEKEKVEKFVKADLISNTKDEIHCKKYIEGKDLDKYSIKRIRYLEYGTSRSPAKLRRATFEELYISPKLLLNSLGELKVTIDTKGEYYCEQQVRMALLWQDLKEVDNSSISGSIKKYSSHSREEMEHLSEKVQLKYLLGILNSKYATILLRNIRSGDYHIVPEHIRNIPIPLADKSKQEEIIALVDKILQLKADGENDIAGLQSQIDSLVYQLYELSPEEIARVEESVK